MFGTVFLLALFGAALSSGLLYFQLRKANADLGDSQPALLIALASSAVFLVALYLSCTVIIPNQNVGYKRVFNVVQAGEPIQQGFHLKAPWVKVELVDVSPGEMNFIGKNALTVHTSDPIQIVLPLTATWRIAPEYVVMYKQKINGGYTSRVNSVIQSSVRDTVARLSYKQGALNNRAALEAAIKRDILIKTEAYFRQQGFGADSDKIIEYGAINLRQIILPGKIVAINNDNAAAEGQLVLQDKLKLVEEKKIAIRATQSKSFRGLVQVPEGMTATDYARILEATSTQMNVETIRDALENNKPITVVVGMGTTPLVSPK